MSITARKSKKVKIPLALLEDLASLADERMTRQKLHSLKNIIIIAVCSILCGADSWLAIERIGKGKLNWFRKFLWLPHGIPSHDTFTRVFTWLNPSALQICLTKWMRDFNDLVKGEVIAIDGKKQRRSFDKASEKSAIHVVTAFACESGIALGLTKVASKSNEITAIPEVLEMVDVRGHIVSIDAIGCQKSIAEKIRESGADYVLAVKKNQLNLYIQIKVIFERIKNADQMPDRVKFIQKEDCGHGRREIRRYWITDQIESISGKNEWKDLKSIGCVESTRVINDRETVETRYFIVSFDPNEQLFAKSARGHWKIENSYHWRLDVIFRADDNRMRLGHSPENFSVLQAVALNLLKNDTSSKDSVRIKRHMCAIDEKYLQKVLFKQRKNFNA